jgi:phosphoglycolate phosphatase-like HAD superfamily hydrolase
MIDSLNLSNAQKNNLKKLRDNLFSQQIRPGLNTSERDMEFVANRENVALDSLLEQIIRDEEVLRMKRKVDQLIDAARKNNFDGTIRLVGPDGVNVFNPKLRRGYVDGDSIEDVITRRLTERLTELGELLTIRRRERKPLPLPAT